MCIQRTQRDLNLCSLINSSESLSIRASGIPKPSPIEVLTRYASPSFSITYSVNTISNSYLRLATISPDKSWFIQAVIIDSGTYHPISIIAYQANMAVCWDIYVTGELVLPYLASFFFLVSEICFSWCSIFSLVWLR